MHEREKGMLGEKLAVAMAAYGRNISDALVEVFFLTLKPYDLGTIDHALLQHVANPDTGQFPPKPADVVRLIEGGTGDRALRAWSMVDRAIRQIGPSFSVAFPCAVTHRVIDDMGGWERLCNQPDDEALKFAGLEFQKRYRGHMQAGGVGADYPAYLIGTAEAYNRAHGKPHQMPVQLIGRDERAKAIAQVVMERGAKGLIHSPGGESAKALLSSVSVQAPPLTD